MAIRLAYVATLPIWDALAVDITYDTMAIRFCLLCDFIHLGSSCSGHYLGYNGDAIIPIYGTLAVDITEDTMAIRLDCDATLPI